MRTRTTSLIPAAIGRPHPTPASDSDIRPTDKPRPRTRSMPLLHADPRGLSRCCRTWELRTDPLPWLRPSTQQLSGQAHSATPTAAASPRTRAAEAAGLPTGSLARGACRLWSWLRSQALPAVGSVLVRHSLTHAAIRVLRVLVSGLRMAWAEGIGFRAETDLRRERYAGDTTRRPRAAARRLFTGATERRHPPLTAPAFPAGVAGLTLLHVGAIVSWFVHAGVRCVCATCAYAHIMRVRVLHPLVRKRLHGRDGWHQWDAKHWPPQHLCSRLT